MKFLDMLDYDCIWFGWLEVEEGGFKGYFFGKKTKNFSSKKFDTN